MIWISEARAIKWFLLVGLILISSILLLKYPRLAEKAIPSENFVIEEQQENQNLGDQDKNGLFNKIISEFKLKNDEFLKIILLTQGMIMFKDCTIRSI